MSGLEARGGEGGERFVRKAEVAERLGVSTRTLNLWEQRGLLRLRRLAPTVVGMLESELVSFMRGGEPAEREGGESRSSWGNGYPHAER